MNCSTFDINNLIMHFLCSAPISVLDVLISQENINCLVNLEKQQEILKNTINNDLIQKYPVKQSNQRAFLKWLINKIEEQNGEVYANIYITYCNLLSSTIEEFHHYRHFLIEGDYISVKESTNTISEGTTGLSSWQGAIELSKWSIENKNKFYGKVVLELGCGVGLTGLCIIKKCFPSQYIFTDYHKIVLEMVSKNIELNIPCSEKKIETELKHDRLKLQLKYNCTDIKIMELKWEDINKYINEQWIIPDIIIGADILYDVNSFYELILGLKKFLSFSDRYAIIAAAIRNEDTISQFLCQLEDFDLCFEECNVPRQTVYIQLLNVPIKILKIFKKN